MQLIKSVYGLMLFTLLHNQSFAQGFELTSPSFQTGMPIPSQYTCGGHDISPKLSWKNIPQNTQSFTLILNDPDAPNGNWVHWIVFNLPSNVVQLAENATLPIEAVSGLNNWNKSGYNGPCPPSGIHRYYFRLYALDTVLQLSESAQYNDVINAMQSHTLGQAVLQGTYRK